jgi:hypothetical protein
MEFELGWNFWRSFANLAVGRKRNEEGTKEGRYPIALAHVGTMGSASPSLIGSPWTSADRSPPLLERLGVPIFPHRGKV